MVKAEDYPRDLWVETNVLLLPPNPSHVRSLTHHSQSQNPSEIPDLSFTKRSKIFLLLVRRFFFA